MIAAITLKMLDPFGTGKLVLFQVTYDKVCTSRMTRKQHLIERLVQDWHALELLPFLFLGLFGVRFNAQLLILKHQRLSGRIRRLFLKAQLSLEQERAQ